MYIVCSLDLTFCPVIYFIKVKTKLSVALITRDSVCCAHGRIQRWGVGAGGSVPLKITKIEGFLAILVGSLKTHKATKLAFNVEPSSVRQGNAI